MPTTNIAPACSPVRASFRTDANLTSKAYKLVKTAGTPEAPDLDVCGAGDLPVGSLISPEDAADYSSTPGYVGVAVGGLIPVSVGAAFGSAGLPYISDASGDAIVATTGELAAGIMLYEQADGDIGVATVAPHTVA